MGDYIPSAPVNDEAKKANGKLPGLGGVYNTVNLHLYHYAGNNPVKYTDPDGRSDCGIYDGEGNYSDKLIKDTIESASKQKIDDIIDKFNEGKEKDKQIDRNTLRDLFFNADKAKELLMEREDLHKDLRDILNRKSPETAQGAKEEGMEKLPWFQSIFHNLFKNDKYISQDGYREGVYDKKTGDSDTSNDVKATFNFFNPNTQPANHKKADVDPYLKWGN